MKNKLLISLACLGILLAITTAYFLARKQDALPPAFEPASNPYAEGIYAKGIVEALQNSGSNVNIYPEVSGVVNKILVKEGQEVKRGSVVLQIEDSIPTAATELAQAQIESAKASLKTVTESYQKQKMASEIDSRSVSKDILDNAENAVLLATANVEVSQKQYNSARSLLAKYQIKVQVDGHIFAVNTSLGSYISPQGVYDTYTQQSQPILVMGSSDRSLAVRCYVDEILLQRLPNIKDIDAYMFIRGSSTRVSLKIVRLQPFVSPKIQLSNQRTERVDVRVLPVIFSFETPKDITIFPGQLVDVYIGKNDVR